MTATGWSYQTSEQSRLDGRTHVHGIAAEAWTSAGDLAPQIGAGHVCDLAAQDACPRAGVEQEQSRRLLIRALTRIAFCRALSRAPPLRP
jgi:hypothetical protein